MAQKFSVSLSKILDDFTFEKLFLPENTQDIKISATEINRPGLQLAGFYDFFDRERIQIFGKSESSYLRWYDTDERIGRLAALFAHQPPAVIIARNLEVPEYVIDLAKEHDVALLRTTESTSDFMSKLNAYLNVELAPRVTRHGVLVEVYGEGILLLGDSGIGKSETAIELIKRGHRLIADDAVEIRRVSDKTLVGTAPENIRHFIELRGIGIINARRIFGMGAVKMTEKIDMVINLEPWDKTSQYDRMGLEEETTDILGIKVTSTTIPLSPGRNLAIIIEVAAMNNRQKKMGYNAAQELLHKLGMNSDEVPQDTQQDWATF